MKLLNILFIPLLFLFFNCKSQTKESIYPTEKFSIIKGKLDDGKPIIGSINTSYINYGHKAAYPWCLKINIALDLKYVNEYGLPLKAESDTANKFEDQLLSKIKKLATAHYVGHFYNDSFLDIYIYLEKPENVHQFLQSEVNKPKLTRGFAYEIKKDPDWDIVKAYFK
ncbi:MAG: DUF695 domain-containing protein [Mucilaginibacter sp.]